MPKFVPRERKHKRLARQVKATAVGAEAAVDVLADSNATQLTPASTSEKEARRQQLRQQLIAPEVKVSGKKRKRLDHYIDTKLRKEENLELIKKLGAHKVDTSLLQSSKKLGRVNETKRERLSRALQRQHAEVDTLGDNEDVLYERRQSVSDEDASDAAAHLCYGDGDVLKELIAPVQATKQALSVGLFGSGLKRPLETGEDGKPFIKKRKRRKKVQPAVSAGKQPSNESDAGHEDTAEGDEQENDMDGSEWNGFDSGNDLQSDASESPVEEDSQTSMESDSDESLVTDTVKPDRKSAFKAWADMQRNAAIGFTPSATTADDSAIRAAFKPRERSPDLIAQYLLAPATSASSRPLAPLAIPRSETIQAARLELPVVQEEQKIMEAIHNNPTVIVCGATGSGKTTQVPQMMLESGFGSRIGTAPGVGALRASEIGPSDGMIGVTQPRRVAAVSVTARVAEDLGPQYRIKVAHQVRYDSTVSRDTAIKFMTDGILLREISQDFVLSHYSAIVIDEAHERSVNTDILIGMLSRIVGLREELSQEQPKKYYPLKLVIMSATLRVNDLAQNERLFKSRPPPIVEAEGRQYPVTVHFSRRTQRDYVGETVRMVAKGHKRLPPGGMLVFVTGQQEILAVMKSLRESLGDDTAGFRMLGRCRENTEQMPLEIDDMEDSAHRKRGDTLEGEESDTNSDSSAEITGLDDAEDAEFAVDDDLGPREALKPHILPLYAALPTAQQVRVFEPPSLDGSRLIVLATNVAETSLTIPGIRYVFDCGRSKEKKYETSTGVQTFEVDWISKASASQRSGRAGRTGPGHCYRLYSSAVYEQFFAEHGVPEILRTPLESTVLQLKAMNIDNVVNFPFPTPPDRKQLMVAEKLLRNLGAIDEKTGRITEVGRELIKYPLSPRFGKMLLLGQRNGVLAHTIALVAALATGDLTLPEAQSGPLASNGATDSDEEPSGEEKRMRNRVDAQAQTAAATRHQAYTRAQATLSRWDDTSDAIKLLTAVAAHAESAIKSQEANSKFCADFFLREKGMSEVQQLRRQLHAITYAQRPHNGTYIEFKDTLPLPTEKERRALNQVVAAGFIDQVAIRADLLSDYYPTFRNPRRGIEVPYRSLTSAAEVDRTASPEAQELHRSVFVHPSSVLAHLAVKEMPGYVVYSHLSRAAPSTIGIYGEGAKLAKTRMHPLAAVSAKALAALAERGLLLEVGKPVGKIEQLDGERRQCWVGLSMRAEEGVRWPVGAWKVLQRRVKGEWAIESVIAR